MSDRLGPESVIGMGRNTHVGDASRWLMVLLKQKAGPTEAEWIALFQEEEGDPEDEVDVRAWYYRLFEESNPWSFVGDGAGTARYLDTFFREPAFGGMPEYYRLEKAPTTRNGSLWRLQAPTGEKLGEFAVQRIAFFSGAQVNAMDRAMWRAIAVPAELDLVGRTLDRWTFGVRSPQGAGDTSPGSVGGREPTWT